MRSEHRRGFGDRIAHRSFGKGGVNNNNRKISPPTTQPARPVRPYCFGAQKDPRGRGSRLAYLRHERGRRNTGGEAWGCSRSSGRLPRDVILIRRHHFALAAPVIVVGLFISPIADLALAAIAEAGRTSQWRGLLTSHELPRVLLRSRAGRCRPNVPVHCFALWSKHPARRRPACL